MNKNKRKFEWETRLYTLLFLAYIYGVIYLIRQVNGGFIGVVITIVSLSLLYLVLDRF